MERYAVIGVRDRARRPCHTWHIWDRTTRSIVDTYRVQGMAEAESIRLNRLWPKVGAALANIAVSSANFSRN